MALLSPSQILPMLIVERVVEYLEERARNSFDTELDINISKYNREKVVHPLLWVSERWRVAALSVIYNNCKIHFDTSANGFDMKYPALSDDLSYPQCHMERLVKRVVAMAPSWNDTGSGKFSSAFFWSTLELPTFPSTATLMVCFDNDKIYFRKTSRSNLPTLSVALADRNKETVNFPHCLRQMTPAATGLNIAFCSYSSTIEESRGQCSNLVQQPCSRNISRLQVESRTDYDLSSLDLHSLSGLTSIVQGFTTACALFAHVAYRSADTLRELSLVCLEEDDWRTLLYGGSNIPAVYSRLTKLLLGFEDDEESMNWAAIDGAVLFPALSEMTLEDDYPFGDELLFRGNRPTLRKLHIPFRMPAKNAFGRCNVFNCSGATWMSLVDVGPLDPSDEDRVVGQSDAQVMQKFRSILEATMTFFLNGAIAAKYLLRALEPTASAAVLHELRLYERPLCASKALSIISAIPSLVTLSSAIYQPVSNVKSIRAREHPRALRRKCPIDNSNFRRLNVLKGENDLADSASDDFDICRNASTGNAWLHYKVDKFTRKIAVVAVKIAALCPNFSHVVHPKEMRGEFSREVALAMTNGPFMPYANTLSRLIYPE